MYIEKKTTFKFSENKIFLFKKKYFISVSVEEKCDLHTYRHTYGQSD